MRLEVQIYSLEIVVLNKSLKYNIIYIHIYIYEKYNQIVISFTLHLCSIASIKVKQTKHKCSMPT